RAAKEDGVCGDHPLEPGLGEPEIGLDRGQGDVDDGHVEDDHELCGDDQSQGAPAPPRCIRLQLGNQAVPPIVGDSNYTREERLVTLPYSPGMEMIPMKKIGRASCRERVKR